MRTTRPMPTEDERDDWHRMELAELINELSDYLSALEWELSGHDCTDLANPISALVMKAYAAGRLNPLPIRSHGSSAAEQSSTKAMAC